MNQYEMLRQVSRTFALSVEQLPRPFLICFFASPIVWKTMKQWKSNAKSNCSVCGRAC
jgi:hypothetical protein